MSRSADCHQVSMASMSCNIHCRDWRCVLYSPYYCSPLSPSVAEWEAHDNMPYLGLNTDFQLCIFLSLQATALGFVKYNLDIPSVEVAHEIRIKGSVLVAAGSHFGIEHHLRITHGVDAATFEEASAAILQVLGLAFLITLDLAMYDPDFWEPLLCSACICKLLTEIWAWLLVSWCCL